MYHCTLITSFCSLRRQTLTFTVSKSESFQQHASGRRYSYSLQLVVREAARDIEPGLVSPEPGAMAQPGASLQAMRFGQWTVMEWLLCMS